MQMRNEADVIVSQAVVEVPAVVDKNARGIGASLGAVGSVGKTVLGQ